MKLVRSVCVCYTLPRLPYLLPSVLVQLSKRHLSVRAEMRIILVVLVVVVSVAWPGESVMIVRKSY